jgi:hypothetical protein
MSPTSRGTPTRIATRIKLRTTSPRRAAHKFASFLATNLSIASVGSSSFADQLPGAKTVTTKDIRHSALLAAPGTLEIGLFSYTRYTLNERVELSLHPLGFFLWPEVDAKVRWLDCDRCDFTLATQHALSYPTWFLGAVAREGTGGLVDPTADNPITFLMDLSVLATWRIGTDSWATVEPRATFRLGEQGEVLDFPFLYQRLGALDSGYTLGLHAGLEGVIKQRVGYEFSATYTHLQSATVDGAFALEALVEARIKLTRDATLPVGLRFAHAQFPIGRRNHWFPYLDFRMVW